MGNKPTTSREVVCSPSPKTASSKRSQATAKKLLHQKTQHTKKQRAIAKAYYEQQQQQQQRRAPVPLNSIPIPPDVDNNSMEGAKVLVHFDKPNMWYRGEVLFCQQFHSADGYSLVDVFFEDGDRHDSIPLYYPTTKGMRYLNPRVVFDKSQGQAEVVHHGFKKVSTQIGLLHDGFVRKDPNISRGFFSVVRTRYITLEKSSNHLLTLSWYHPGETMTLKGSMKLDSHSHIFDQGYPGKIIIHGKNRLVSFRVLHNPNGVSATSAPSKRQLQQKHAAWAHVFRVSIKQLRLGWIVQRELSFEQELTRRQSSTSMIEEELQNAMKRQDIQEIRTLMKKRANAQQRKKDQHKRELGETKQTATTKQTTLGKEGKMLLFGTRSHCLTCTVCLEEGAEQDNNNNKMMMIKTICNHDMHVACAHQLLDNMWSQRVTFNYMTCPSCRAPLHFVKDSSSSSSSSSSLLLLSDKIQMHSLIRKDVVSMVFAYVQKQEYTDIQTVTDNNASAYARHKMEEDCLGKINCFLCEDCDRIFASGRVDCGELQNNMSSSSDNSQHLQQSKEMRCEECIFDEINPSSKKCRAHGVLYAVFKCDCCCSIASYDCSGNHYCDVCHGTLNKKPSVRPKCRGQVGDCCPLGVPHPLNAARNHSEKRDGFVVGCTKCLGIDEQCETPSFGVMPETKERWANEQIGEKKQVRSRFDFCVDFV